MVVCCPRWLSAVNCSCHLCILVCQFAVCVWLLMSIVCYSWLVGIWAFGCQFCICLSNVQLVVQFIFGCLMCFGCQFCIWLSNMHVCFISSMSICCQFCIWLSNELLSCPVWCALVLQQCVPFSWLMCLCLRTLAVHLVVSIDYAIFVWVILTFAIANFCI